MKIKTLQLTEAALDWAVAKCEGLNPPIVNGSMDIGDCPDYSTDWDQGGPIIEREGIEIVKGNPLYFPKGNERGDYYEPLWIALWAAGNMHGRTPLEAAMRCYIASKLGNEVDIPDELVA